MVGKAAREVEIQSFNQIISKLKYNKRGNNHMTFKPTFKQHNYKNYRKKDYNKNYTNHGSQQLRKGEKLVVSKFTEMKTGLEKKYIGFVTDKEGKHHRITYPPTRFRDEAVTWFEEQARLLGGKLGVVSVLS
jgi:hypothetical protein